MNCLPSDLLVTILLYDDWHLRYRNTRICKHWLQATEFLTLRLAKHLLLPGIPISARRMSSPSKMSVHSGRSNGRSKNLRLWNHFAKALQMHSHGDHFHSIEPCLFRSFSPEGFQTSCVAIKADIYNFTVHNQVLYATLCNFIDMWGGMTLE